MTEALPPSALLMLLASLRDRALAADSLNALAFSIANDPFSMLGYRQALVRRNMRWVLVRGQRPKREARQCFRVQITELIANLVPQLTCCFTQVAFTAERLARFRWPLAYRINLLDPFEKEMPTYGQPQQNKKEAGHPFHGRTRFQTKELSQPEAKDSNVSWLDNHAGRTETSSALRP